MYKGKKSGRKNTGKNLGDITLNDFANSSVAKTRTKKSSTNVSHVINKEKDLGEKPWDEKDFDGEFDFVEEENEDGTVSYVMRKVQARRRRKTVSIGHDAAPEGNEYPLDVWFLISEYIRPEDVGCFAGICKSSFAVVNTAKFWFSLYRRYYKSTSTLPERLQPECMFRLCGIRASVIRALFFMYGPFAERVTPSVSFERHPDVLLKRRCVLMWYQKTEKKHWLYYFKMKENVACRIGKESGPKPDLFEMLEDISANPDENCRVLVVTCMHFIPVPIVQGLTLISVSLNLSQGFRHHRLLLRFGSGAGGPEGGGNGHPVVLLDPVLNVRVLDWWHPLYPFDHDIQRFLSGE